MDSFDLHWPRSTATLYTDGKLVKIVVRDKRGPSGTINNIELCKDRVAFGIDFAPTLLKELQAKGYGDLADDIEQRVEPPLETPVDPVAEWLNNLPGDDTWAECGAKRSTKWRELSNGVLMKMPAKRGNPEWVLKDTRSEGKPTYVCAAAFKGLLRALHAKDPALIPTAVSACAELMTENSELQAAISAWPKN